MATQDLTGGASFTNSKPAQYNPGEVTLYKRIDFSKTNAASSDLLKLFKIPKGVWLLNSMITVITPEGGTATVDLGVHADDATPTAVDADGLQDGTNINATAGTSVCPRAMGDTLTGGSTVNGYLTTANQLVTMTVNNALDTAVIDVYVRVWWTQPD